jgi:hypothetical protein
MVYSLMNYFRISGSSLLRTWDADSSNLNLLIPKDLIMVPLEIAEMSAFFMEFGRQH